MAKNTGQRGGGNNKSEKQPCEHRRRRRRGRRCAQPAAEIPLQPVERITLEQISTLQPVEDPAPEQVDIPEGSEACGEPTSEQGKSMRGEEQQRGTARY